LRKILPVILFYFGLITLSAQSPLRLQDEVEHLDSIEYGFNNQKEIILFTGSSSIRKWENITNYFPDYQIINTGFGGSQMSDLLYYADGLILKYAPDKIFIYEGDNDVAWGKSVNDIMQTTDSLVNKLTSHLPDVEIIFISVKPSPARWDFKDIYLSLNQLFKNYCDQNPKLYYSDVWYPMIDLNDKPIGELYVADSLHMSTAGYELWADELIKYLD
jgi:hypothetical protein